jgi:hypothetical protein
MYNTDFSCIQWGVDTEENWPVPERPEREAGTKIMMLLLEQFLELASACFQRSK